MASRQGALDRDVGIAPKGKLLLQTFTPARNGTFVCLNAFQAEFLGAKAGLVQAKYGYPALLQLIKPMLKDESVWRLVRERGYHPDFVEFCSQIRARFLDQGPPASHR